MIGQNPNGTYFQTCDANGNPIGSVFNDSLAITVAESAAAATSAATSAAAAAASAVATLIAQSHTSTGAAPSTAANQVLGIAAITALTTAISTSLPTGGSTTVNGVALDTTVQATNVALSTLNTDLVTLHTDVGIIHSDLVAISGKLVSNPSTAAGQAAQALESGGNLAAILAELILILAKQPALNADGGAAGHTQNGSLDVTSQATNTALATLNASVTTSNTDLVTLHTDAVNLLNKLNATLAVSGTFFQATQPVSGSAAVGNPPTSPPLSVSGVDASGNKQHLQIVAGRTLVDGSQVTQPISAVTLPLPAGAATSAGQGTINTDTGIQVHLMNSTTSVTANIGTSGTLGLDTSLQQIKAAIQATVSLTGTVWYDATVTPVIYYVRRETNASGTLVVGWENPAGGTATPTVANLQAVSNAQNIASENLSYTASSSGSGYAVGDILIHAFGIDTASSPQTIAYSLWMNAGPSVVSGTIIAAPSAGTYAQATQAVSAASLPLPAGAAQEAGNLASILTQITAMLAKIVAAPALDTTVQATNTALGLLHTDAGTNHSDMVALHTDSATTLHTDLTALLTKLNATLAVSGSFFQTTQPVSGTAAVGSPPTAAPLSVAGVDASGNKAHLQIVGGRTVVDGSQVTQPISAVTLPLPAGAATSAGQGTINTSDLGLLVHVMNPPATQAVTGAVTSNIGTTGGLGLDTSLQQIKAAIQATVSLTGTIWYDATVTPVIYYVRREVDASGTITIVWENPAGGTANPTVANLQAVSNSQNIASENVIYSATAAGTGYVSGDVLIHAFGIDTVTMPATVAYSVWMNAGPSVASGSIISAPTTNTYAQAGQSTVVTQSALPSGAAQETGNLAQILTKLSSALTVAGSVSVSNLPATQAVTGAFYQTTQPVSGSVSITNLPSTQAVTGTFYQATQPISGSVSVGNFPSTQPVSLASVPLPTGAATLAGQGTINADLGIQVHLMNTPNASAGVSLDGTDATGVTVPTGGIGIRGWLSGIYKAVTGTLAVSGSVSVSNLPASQAVTGTFFPSTQPVSAVSLPLPTGAAQESSGNLASIAATNTTMAVRGQQTSAQSTSVVFASDGLFSQAIGAQTDTVATSTGSFSIIAFVKAMYTNGVSILGRLPVLGVQLPAASLSVSSAGVSVTQTAITVTATSQQLIAANANRKYLAWMVVGTADVTVVPVSSIPGSSTAVVSAGLIYQASGAGKQGASEEFPTSTPTNAFQCVAATTGSIVYVWEGI